MFVCLTEAIKNIRTNLLLNAAIVIMIVSIMTFLGIVTMQVQISGVKTEVVLKQESFVELSQYYFWVDGENQLKMLFRRSFNSDDLLPEEEAYLYYPISNDPIINAKYLSNSDKVWAFYRKLKSIPGVYIETVRSVGYNKDGQHDAYNGHYTFDSTKDRVVTPDFFDAENLTLLKGRLPQEDDFYIDEDGIQVVPLLVGYQLRDYFEIGDIVTVKDILDRYDSTDPKKTIVKMYQYSKGKVVGILDQVNTITTQDGDHFIPLYNNIIRVVKDYTPDTFPELKSNDDLYIYASYNKLQDLISAKVFINKTNEEQAAKDIQQAINEAGLSNLLTLTKAGKYGKITASLEKERTETYLHVALLVGILCVFGLGILILMLNIANEKDYSIHRLVGATKNNVALMTTVQMFILLIVSDVLIHYPYILQATGLFLNGDSMIYIFNTGKIYTVIAVMNIIILALTYIISRIYASATDISASIKDKE